MHNRIKVQKMVAMLAALTAQAAFADNSVTLFGNMDIAVDHIHKGQGNLTGTVFSASPTGRALFGDSSSLNRVTSSTSSVNGLGIKGSEDLGSGYIANFMLEGQFQIDTGAQSGQDSRMWGRQSYVGLTTPAGEIRLGRQYAPMFYAFALSTVEALGGSDIYGSGLTVNNLQVRQDNQVSYWLKTGHWLAEVAYTPNGGVDKNISIARGQPAGLPTGQIIGGQTAGNESTSSRGQSLGLFVNYTFDAGTLINGAIHTNKFDDATLVLSANGAPISHLDKYSSWVVTGKYTVPTLGTEFAGSFHQGKFVNDGPEVDPQVNSVALGFKHPIGPFAVGAEWTHMKFTNFTKGQDSAVVLAGDYNLSKRTKVFTRIGYLKDKRGDLVSTATPGVNLAGGPFALLTGLGALETPWFSGAGANIDASTKAFSVGIRHTF